MEEIMFCKACGNEVLSTTIVCPNCGSSTAPTFPQGRNRIVAAVLAICLGFIGIHKFYLGKMGQGIVYLVLSFTAVPMFLGFIEGAIYASMTDEAFHTKYH
jgi:TM2 domain-containing membrane protein YozV